METVRSSDAALPQAVLTALNTTVGDLASVDLHASCVMGVAAVMEAASMLSLNLRPLPVRFMVMDTQQRPQVAFGGALFTKAYDPRRDPDGIFTAHAGHIVLVSDDQGSVLDPTFWKVPRPFSLGTALTMMCPLKGVPDHDAMWTAPAPGAPEFLMTYMGEDEPNVLDAVNAARPRVREVAQRGSDAVAQWFSDGARGPAPVLPREDWVLS